MITGAAGSIGSELVRQVAAFHADSIVLYDQAETPMHNMHLEMAALYPSMKIHLFVGDIQNKERVRQAYEQFHPDFVFHAAAYKHVPMMEINPTEAILTNVRGTRNVADLALEYGVEKFVMISTDKAVNPTMSWVALSELPKYMCSHFSFSLVVTALYRVRLLLPHVLVMCLVLMGR